MSAHRLKYTVLPSVSVLALVIAGCTSGRPANAQPESSRVAAEEPAKELPARTTAGKIVRISGKPKSTYFSRTAESVSSGAIKSSPAASDGLEAATDWRAARWADLAVCRHFRDPRSGRRILYLATGGGKQGKCAAELARHIIPAPAGRITMQVFNNGTDPVRVAIGLRTAGDFTYYESPARPVPVGRWSTVSFDLAAEDYKTAASNWQHRSALKTGQPLARVAILMYHGGKLSRILVDGLTIESRKPQRPVRKPSAPAER